MNTHVRSALCVALLIVPAHHAQAALILAGDVNGTLFCATDNNVACVFGTQLFDTDLAVGTLELEDTTIGGVLVEGSLHQANLATALLNSSSLTIRNTLGVPVTLQTSISATDFIGPRDIAFTTGSGTFVESVGSSLTYTWWNDPSNSQGGQTATDRPGNLVDTFAVLALLDLDSHAHDGGPFPVSDLGLFSMTLGFDLTLLPGDSLISRGQSITKELTAVVPEPGSLLLLGSGLVLVARKVRQRVIRA